VSETNIRIALEEEISDQDYRATALRLGKKKIASDNLKIRIPEDRQKVYRYLTGKGYEMSVIQDIVKEILESSE
jgi:SOS response regulatory protein OraA/RecX